MLGGPEGERLSQRALEALRCPACHSALERDEVGFCCRACRKTYPVIGGVPVLIDDATSIFRVTDYLLGDRVFFGRRTRWDRLAGRLIPSLGRNFHTRENFRHLVRLLKAKSPNPLVLVLGAGEGGYGVAELADPAIEVINLDVSLTELTDVIADGHNLSFQDGLFDCVIAQAVLEHVLDPAKCVSEMHRVLARDGYVYAETPFMQPIHGGRYDFTRFTLLGHRRLFREFEQIAAGIGGGPASSFAWAYEYLLLSLVPFERMRGFVKAFARLTAFWMKYLDPLLERSPHGWDSAWGFWFLGRRADGSMSDAEILALYPPHTLATRAPRGGRPAAAAP